MLYKNDEVYKMTPAEHKEIHKRYPKFPLRLTYPESRIKPSRLKHNTLPDKPNSISFPLHSVKMTETGTQSWRYAENKIQGTNGQTIWVPHNLILRGTRMLLTTDIELVFWLVKFCPFMEGGENWNQKTPKCAIEDLVGDAEKRAMKEEEMATVKAMIYSTKMGLGEKKLRQVAKAYFITGVEELSFPQVKLAVEATIQRDKRNGITKFLDLIEAEQVLTIRSNLQQAVDKNLITYMVQKKQWAWVTSQGKKNEPICLIGAVADPNEALYDYYMGSRRFAQEVTSALKGERVVIGMGADVPDPVLEPGD